MAQFGLIPFTNKFLNNMWRISVFPSVKINYWNQLLKISGKQAQQPESRMNTQVLGKFSILRKVHICKTTTNMLIMESVYLKVHLLELSISPPIMSPNIGGFDLTIY